MLYSELQGTLPKQIYKKRKLSYKPVVLLRERERERLIFFSCRYRRLALKYHPDISNKDKGAAEKSREIAEAYDVLSDSTNFHITFYKLFC